MAKKKFYSVHGECTDKLGYKHTITLVGQLEQVKELQLDTKERGRCLISTTTTVKKRRLTIGMAICHRFDTFDKEVGENLAKRRIRHHEDIGYIETEKNRMLTDDAIMAQLLVNLSYISDHIDWYLPEGSLDESEETIERFRREDGMYDLSGANADEIIEVANIIGDEDRIIVGEGRVVTKADIAKAMRDAMEGLANPAPAEAPLPTEADAPAEPADEQATAEAAAAFTE